MTGPDRSQMTGDGGPTGVDPLQRLAAANPVSATDDPNGPHARALYQEVLRMSATSTTRVFPRRLAIAGGVAAALALGTTGVVLLGGDPEPEVPIASEEPNGEEVQGPGMAMCAFMYSPQTLADREFAFDGTLTAVEGDAATFEIGEVFRGDFGETVTLGGAELIASSEGTVTLGGGELQIGDRALVAGDGGYAWACGFTQAYDESVADQWRETLR